MAELKHILMVEDEPDIQAIARLSLETLGGYAIDIFGSGHEALAALETLSPDLILVDVAMPGMDGPSLLRMLRSNPKTRAIPAIFMADEAQTQEADTYRAMGAWDVIAKPFDPKTLAGTVTTIWMRHRG